MAPKHIIFDTSDDSDSDISVRPKRARTQQIKQIDRFQTFAADLQAAGNAAVLNENRVYRRAAILSIQFDNVDFPVNKQRDDLLDVLRRVYGFNTETYIIKTVNTDYIQAGNDLKARLEAFRKTYQTSAKTPPGSLLVYYYTGHASRSGTRPDIYGKLNRQGNIVGPYLNWERVAVAMTELFGGAADQYLTIMDCCDAAAATVGKGMIELIGATSWHTGAEADKKWSFTLALTKQLKKANGQEISAAQLVSAIMHDARKENM